MECERVKPKKKKKVKVAIERELSFTDIEFPSNNRIEFQLTTEIENKDVVANSEVAEEKEEHTEISNIKPDCNDYKIIDEIVHAASAPTAPNVDTASLTTLPKNENLYPGLEDLKVLTEELSINMDLCNKEIESTLEPFKESEMEQLYSNIQIQQAEIFETEFISKEMNDNQKLVGDHLLYCLLRKYAHSRVQLKINQLNLNTLKKNCNDKLNKVWKMERKTISGHGTCSDGNSVRVNHQYEQAVFDEEIFSILDQQLKELLKLSCYAYTKSSYDSELYKIQIEQLIRNLLSTKEFARVTVNSPILLNDQTDPECIEKVCELRLSISILFSFLRDTSPDKNFTTDVKSWIGQLVSLQLRVATWRDHLFILYHLLRCPVGISNWAPQLVQIPAPQFDQHSPFNCASFQYCIAFVASLLMPIKDRNRFLERMTKDLNNSIDPVEDDIWVLVDSEGEEGNTPTGECVGLKENDLVSLFDQIPLEQVFRMLTLIESKNGELGLDDNKITGHHLIKSIAFATKFIGILRTGLKTYDTERYKQFGKRLGRLVKHTVFYVADLIKLFLKNSKNYKDPAECQRIRIEFDLLVIRAINYIYESQMLSLWQYLVDFPYEMMETRSIWRLLYYLHLGEFYEVDDAINKMQDASFLEKFNISVVEIAPDDLYFLLQSFSMVALARDKTDWMVIRFITLDLLNIGFINETTKDICYKTVKDLLYNIVFKYPELITDILQVLKSSLPKVGALSPYLCKSLPINKWVPNAGDLEVLATWLLNFQFDSVESTTARVLFGHLNWGFDQHDELFLSHEIHVRMSCLVCDVYIKQVGEIMGSGVFESLRTMSSLGKGPSKKEQFSTWCWNMVTMLRLHSIDRYKSPKNLPQLIYLVPELEATQSIYQGFTENRPLALYLSLLTSQLGHSLPQICHRGFDVMKNLLTDYRHSKVIRCLELITPLFLETPESLFTCDGFISILTLLLSADKTYAKLAKDLVTVDSKGPVLTLMGNMIQTQLLNYSRFGLPSPMLLVNLWLQCLTRVPQWNKDSGVVHILDVMTRVAYQFQDCYYTVREHFRPFFSIAEIKVPKSTGILNFISGSNMLDILTAPSSDAVWLSLLLLEMEFDLLESQNSIWPELLVQLIQNDKSSLSSALKKAISLQHQVAFPPSSLVVYKLATLITKCSSSHFLYPILCQQFFFIYLSRIPVNKDDHVFYEAYGVTDKMYAGDISLMKKLKKSLIEAETYYNTESLMEIDDAKIQFLSSCSRLFKTFLLWLEETQLNKMSQQNIVLPPQFDLQKLALIFHGNKSHWTEYLCLKDIRETQKHCINSWLAAIFRYLPFRKDANPSISDANENVKERIFERLKLYDLPKPPPQLVKEKVLMGSVDESKLTLYLLQTEYKILETYARQFNMMVKEHNALDGNYKDAVRFLFKNESKFRVKTASCSRVFEQCSGTATIRLEFFESHVNDHIKNKLEENREMHGILLKRELSKPDENVVKSNFTIQYIIGELLYKYNKYKISAQESKCEAILQIGTGFFYEILNRINENIEDCPITQELCRDSISRLGTFVQQNHDSEGLNLLKLALKRPNIVNLIAELFTPAVASPKYFLQMYKLICDSYAARVDPHLLFVLLSKFDMDKWLQLNKPKLIDISNLIQLILKGMELWNYQNSELLQDLLTCHLIKLFEHNFPEHYGDILQNVLMAFSNKRLKPNVLVHVLNSFYRKVGAKKLENTMDYFKLKEDFRNFASKQNILLYNDMHATTQMLANNFHTERLQHGLHGLYPKYSDYCEVIALLLGSIGHSVIAAAIHAYPGVVADQLISWLWPCLNEMFAPWLIPYYPENMKDAPANWIQQFTASNAVLLPFSDIYIESAGKISQVYYLCLQFLLEMLPASNQMLGLMFNWYNVNFASKLVPHHVLNHAHNLLMKLPWDRFKPLPVHIEAYNRILQQFIPESHIFVGYIFLRVSWTEWVNQNVKIWDITTTQKMLSILLMMFIKLSYEPKVRESIRIVNLLQESCSYPWHLLNYEAIESVLNWFVMSTEPSVILKIPTEHEAIDSSVLILLQTASSVVSSVVSLSDELNNYQQQSQVQAKRILYVRSITRLLKGCGAKLQKLLATKQGTALFHNACISLLNIVNALFMKAKVSKEKEAEATNLLVEIIGGLDTQSESISRLFADAICTWQSSIGAGNILLSSSLSAIGMCKSFPFSVCLILESTIFNFMRVSESSASSIPSWSEIYNKARMANPTFDLHILANNNLLLVLQLFSSIRIRQSIDVNDQLKYIKELQLTVANFKSTEATEAKLALMWGLLITSGGHILKTSNVSRNQLLELARFFQMNCTQAEGWGEGLLGAIGFKKDPQTNKKRILQRCLTLTVFAMFPDGDHNNPKLSKLYDDSMTELKSTLSNKKFSDVRSLGLNAISLIESCNLKMLENLPGTIAQLIRLFYNDSFLISTETFWK